MIYNFEPESPASCPEKHHACRRIEGRTVGGCPSFDASARMVIEHCELKGRNAGENGTSTQSSSGSSRIWLNKLAVNSTTGIMRE